MSLWMLSCLANWPWICGKDLHILQFCYEVKHIELNDNKGFVYLGREFLI